MHRWARRSESIPGMSNSQPTKCAVKVGFIICRLKTTRMSARSKVTRMTARLLQDTNNFQIMGSAKNSKNIRSFASRIPTSSPLRVRLEITRMSAHLLQVPTLSPLWVRLKITRMSACLFQGTNTFSSLGSTQNK